VVQKHRGLAHHGAENIDMCRAWHREPAEGVALAAAFSGSCGGGRAARRRVFLFVAHGAIAVHQVRSSCWCRGMNRQQCRISIHLRFIE